MATYSVDFDCDVSADEFTAVDLVDLGEQIAYHLGLCHVLTSGTYDAVIGEDRGEITQAGRPPISFSITRKEA